MPRVYVRPTEIRISGGTIQAWVLFKAAYVISVCSQGCKPLVRPGQPLWEAAERVTESVSIPAE